MNRHDRSDVMMEIGRLISSARICMVSNTMLNWPLTRQSLKNQWFDISGHIWFLFLKTNIESAVFENGKMEVFYADSNSSSFLSLSGEAALVSNNEVPRERSFPFFRTLDNEALAPTLGVVKFTPSDVYMWDESAHNMAPLLLSGEVVAATEAN